MKTCYKCQIKKFKNEFYKDAGMPDGYRADCKTCKNKKTAEWREKNKEYYNKSMRDYRAKQDPNDRRDVDLKCWFGLPYGWYKSTLDKQGNVCAICKKPNKSTKRCLAVDHHHESGRVRGIVCYNCNRLLHAFDNLDLYNSIMAYLKKHEVNNE